MKRMNDMIEKIKVVKNEVKKVIVGKDDCIDKILMAVLAGGHILMEDTPGVGKTTLAMACAKAMDLSKKRMQFTPDVLPSDVVGFSILDREGKMTYQPGAVMCNIFLADELNRTSPKSQSALLEVMEEGKVTVDGETREVPKPFVVIATQNPLVSIGTQKLPESQLDRFMLKLHIGYPTLEQEIMMLKGRKMENPLEQVQPVLTAEEILEMQKQVREIFVHDNAYRLIVSVAQETRNDDNILQGLSPRGSLALLAMAKAVAFMAGREYVVPEDVSYIFSEVVSHRMIWNKSNGMSDEEKNSYLNQLLRKAMKKEAAS